MTVNTRQTMDVDLLALLELWQRDIMLTLNCHAVGQVQKFNKDNQTVEVQISYDRKFIEDQEDGDPIEVAKPYPLLVDVPVVCLRGGSAGVTFPIQKGDECLLMFNDRDIDNWFEGKKSGFVRSPRTHSISDAIALVGLSSKESFIQSYDEERASLYNGDTRVAVSADKILIENQTATLNDLIQELVTELQSLTTVGSATTQSISPANVANLTTIATKFEGLLE